MSCCGQNVRPWLKLALSGLQMVTPAIYSVLVLLKRQEFDSEDLSHSASTGPPSWKVVEIMTREVQKNLLKASHKAGKLALADSLGLRPSPHGSLHGLCGLLTGTVRSCKNMHPKRDRKKCVAFLWLSLQNSQSHTVSLLLLFWWLTFGQSSQKAWLGLGLVEWDRHYFFF